ncbi:hypothetical protein F442_15816 [Phytophthora nicotianae P10297]|uniref:Uncharacterized protein n=2 Tax=Phytophthora nicotianae TaxID=4792 RepID=W2YMF0_PHYNI|nr:hypothetical protein F444_15951 [Phytophthora nicotianae P1976]ETP36190.1 hypothetical protein F442_15816 [Phytophthora nicotianae P10297]
MTLDVPVILAADPTHFAVTSGASVASAPDSH